MQLTYRGIHFQSESQAAQAPAQKSAGTYRGVPFSFQSVRESESHANSEQHDLRYRGVPYAH
ncbi:MAG: DUF4278 domain-containing protein [Cyanobacteria bacterium P01_D01_bin.73]